LIGPPGGQTDRGNKKLREIDGLSAIRADRRAVFERALPSRRD